MSTRWPDTIPALITPFDSDGEVDIDAHRHNVTAAAAAGASGVLIAGSTGEGPYLEPGERRTLVSEARSAQNNMTVVCGVSAETDREAVRQIHEAASGGADAILVVTPGALVRNRMQPIVDFLTRTADAAPLPVFLYTVPMVTGYELPIEAVIGLASHPNIVGMKDSGGDYERLEHLGSVLSDDFIVYTGSSKALADGAARGAHGAITASANYALDLVSASAGGDRAAQRALAALIAVIEPHGVPGTKFAASLTGMRPGSSRLPLQPLTPSTEAEIRRAV